MTDFLFEYGLFFLKALTIVGSVIAVVLTVLSASRGDAAHHGLKVEKLNDKYREMADSIRRAVMTKSEWREYAKAEKKALKKEAKAKTETGQRIFVLQFKGDMRASAVESLREEVSAIVAVAGPEDEVVVCLENSGGVVHDHGLGASQLERIKHKNIPLTVVVDKVAASGGYLMASVANHIVAAPFAIIGSIGVLAQLPNFNRFLTERGIDFEQITAGKYKRTLTMFGKNTDADRDKTRQDLEEVNTLFKTAVTDHRPGLDIESVATGEYWYGTRAKELGLIDEVGSSDDYLMRRANDARIYAVTWKVKESWFNKLQGALAEVAASIGLGPRLP